MPTLKLKTLTCHETEDNWGSDDAYIRVNGQKVWGPKEMDDNQTRTLNKDVPFTTRADIDLFDEDDTDPDDHLGVHVAWEKETGQGEQHADFHADDCNYRLIYEVV